MAPMAAGATAMATMAPPTTPMAVITAGDRGRHNTMTHPVWTGIRITGETDRYRTWGRLCLHLTAGHRSQKSRVFVQPIRHGAQTGAHHKKGKSGQGYHIGKQAFVHGLFFSFRFGIYSCNQGIYSPEPGDATAENFGKKPPLWTHLSKADRMGQPFKGPLPGQLFSRFCRTPFIF